MLNLLYITLNSSLLGTVHTVANLSFAQQNKRKKILQNKVDLKLTPLRYKNFIREYYYVFFWTDSRTYSYLHIFTLFNTVIILILLGNIVLSHVQNIMYHIINTYVYNLTNNHHQFSHSFPSNRKFYYYTWQYLCVYFF